MVSRIYIHFFPRTHLLKEIILSSLLCIVIFVDMDWIFVSLQICSEALPPYVMLFADGAFDSYLGLDEVMKVGAWSNGTRDLMRRDTGELGTFCPARTQGKGSSAT